MIAPEPWLSRLMSHLPTVRARADVESVHELRTAVARLRVWLSLGTWRVLQDDLRWLRDQAAAVRDYDVQLEHRPPPRWASYLRGRREGARARLVRALKSDRCASVVLALSAMPAVPRDRAQKALGRFVRRVRDRADGLRGRSSNLATLHGLRRAVRSVRYALEWLQEDASEVIVLQEALGDACDEFVALRALRRHGSGDHAGKRHARRLERRLRRSVDRALVAWQSTRGWLKELEMDLYIIRHAKAVPRSKSIDEAKRPLTDRGRREWRAAVCGLARLGVRFDRVYHSPWLRAVATAELLADLVAKETVVTKELAKRPTATLLGALRGRRIALVGHQPWLGELVGMLTFGRPDLGGRFELRKGSVVWLEGDPRPRGMVVRAVLPPQLLRFLAAPSNG